MYRAIIKLDFCSSAAVVRVFVVLLMSSVKNGEATSGTWRNGAVQATFDNERARNSMVAAA